MSKKQESSKSKRQMLREQRAKRQRQQRMGTIAVVAVVALVIAGLLIYPSIKSAMTPVGTIVMTTPEPRPDANLNSMGNPDAPVKIEEFSDFQCPFCKRFADETEKQIVDTYVATGKVYFTYTPFGPGGSFIGPESVAAAEAAFCAGDQNKFWEYHDMLFANQTGENVGDFTDKRLVAFAEALNLNMTEFNSCYNSQKYKDKVQQGLVEGSQKGIGGTPSFLINGTKLEGALPFSDFQTAIDAALAAAGSK
jgi:protein-disulfide isomerase